MTDKQLIPNAVGRIDAITKAIRDGDRERAIELLQKEGGRVLAKKKKILDEYWRAAWSLDSINDFEIEISASAEKWIQARRECGWKGETE